MSLLLTCDIQEYDIDIRGRLRLGSRQDRVSAPGPEPLPDELPMEPVGLDHQHTLHRWPRP